ncbi:MAG: molybdopterin-binding protein [Chloroflexota bacterium]
MNRPLVPAGRRLATAELLSIGTELTSGETRDTNAAELARSLTDAGLEVGRLSALPDRLDAVQDAFRAALQRSDLVVSTGGLGPTPDDLTREAIAAVCNETPVVDRTLETWLRGLWARRGIPFLAINLKQAWLIPSGRAIANPNGTAPGWWIDRPDGQVIVALPGPPREMLPMWHDTVLPDLRSRRLGTDRAVRTLRLTGIGESVVADRLGEELLRRTNPEVATYARADAVDVRMSAVGRAPVTSDETARTAAELLDEVEPVVLAAVGEHVWARGATTWAEALDEALDRLGQTVAVREIGTGGALGTLLGARSWLTRLESLQLPPRAAGPLDAAREATAIRAVADTDVGLVVIARPRGPDTAVSVAVAGPRRTVRRRTLVFLSGDLGRSRAAIAAAAVLLETLRAEAGNEPAGSEGGPGSSRGVSAAQSARGRPGRG